MAATGRPRLTEDVLRERIVAYCARYGVVAFNEAGFPAYPAGKRETRQHREWVVLFKAFTRLRRRTDRPHEPHRAAVLQAQKGLCPVCAEPVGTDDVFAAPPARHGTLLLVHRACNELLRLAAKLGPSSLDRVRDHLWPPPAEAQGRGTRSKPR
jgi:hypothetical protein